MSIKFKKFIKYVYYIIKLLFLSTDYYKIKKKKLLERMKKYYVILNETTLRLKRLTLLQKESTNKDAKLAQNSFLTNFHLCLNIVDFENLKHYCTARVLAFGFGDT